MLHNNKKFILCFIKRIFKELGPRNLPRLIVQLCLNFFNENEDEWDTRHVHSSTVIQDSCVRKIQPRLCYNSIFLKNIAKSGIHTWIFRIIDCGRPWILIGIEPASNKVKTCHGLRYKSGNRQTICQRFSESVTSYSITTVIVSQNDLIEMRVDFHCLTVAFFQNKILVSEVEIQSDAYRAGVSLSSLDSAIELIGYQHVLR